VGDRLDGRLVTPPEGGDLLARGGVDRDVGGVELEGEAYLVALDQRVGVHGRDEVAAPRLHGQKPLGHEPRQRVVDRAPRDAQLGGELVEAELRARAGIARKDPLAERLVDLVVEVGAGEQDGHGRHVT